MGLSASKPINNNGRICWDSPPAVDQPACMAVIAMTEKEVRHPREQRGGKKDFALTINALCFFFAQPGPEGAQRLSPTPYCFHRPCARTRVGNEGIYPNIQLITSY